MGKMQLLYCKKKLVIFIQRNVMFLIKHLKQINIKFSLKGKNLSVTTAYSSVFTFVSTLGTALYFRGV